MTSIPNKPLILFDGVCNLCNRSVQFIIKRDTKKQFLFASLQSDAAKNILLQLNQKNYDPDTILLIEDAQLYQRSTAALRIARKLDGWWRLLYHFILVPRFIRDYFYDIIANNRYRWFGKRDSCMVPGEDVRGRFLN
ncbi:MAG: DUF393 domain-containing protein [Flavobacteriaceae bacterium]|nr:DUF393 domain-containing protein [Flavobacteriaceae bacterium]